MSSIKIFKSNKKIDLPTLIDSRALICANSGGGKSFTVRKLMEEAHGKVLSIILDIEGEFKTLREQFDFLLIGDEGDVPLSLKSAHLLPKKILELNVSAIIDISDLKRQERIQYVKKFLEAMMEVPRKLWKACIVVLDEAHSLCGQQEKQDSTPSVIDLMTRGRKRGFCGVLCTQRISKLHKDAVAECNNTLIGRTGLDIDMKRASEILGFTNKKDMLSLRDLDAGEFFVFGTAISKKVEKEKVAEVQTTHPKVGMDLREKIVPPTQKIKSILKELNDLPKEEEKKITNLNDYKTKIMELKREIRILSSSKNKPVIDENQLNNSMEKGFRAGIKNQEAHHQLILNEYKKREKIYQNKLGKLAEILKVPLPPMPEYKQPKEQPQRPKFRFNPEVRKKIEEVKPEETNMYDGEYNLNKCEKKLYSLLFQYSERSFTKPQIGTFTGYSHTSGGFSNAISHLRQLGLIEGSNNDLKVKELQSELALNFDFSKEAIISKLNKCEREIYEVLLANPYQDFSKEDLALETPTQYSSTSGGFSNSISRLNTLGLIERSNGMIKLNQKLLEIEI